MTLTALRTFMLKTSKETLSVEVRGSWDNFSKSYSLEKDLRMGAGHWRGCHTFDNITCDGDNLDKTKRRSGALMMGGTYWYYYLLNSEREDYDRAEPFTNDCPMLPGQTVNVLEIPMQEKTTNASPNGSSTSVDSMLVFTLDPSDKYRAPGVRRAATTSAIERKKSRELLSRFRSSRLPDADVDLNGRRSAPRTGQPTLEKQPVLSSLFSKMRPTRSAGSNLRSGLAWPRKVFSRSGSSSGLSPECSENVPEVPQIPDWASKSGLSNGQILLQPVEKKSTSLEEVHPPQPSTPSLKEVKSASQGAEPPPVESLSGLAEIRDANSAHKTGPSPDQIHVVPELTSHLTPNGQASDNSCCFETTPKASETSATASTRPKGTSVSSHSQESIIEKARSAFGGQSAHWALIRSLPGKVEYDGPPGETLRSSIVSTESTVSSYAQSGDFSPLLTNTTHSGQMSPLHLSQPETPVMSEYDFESKLNRVNATDALEIKSADFDCISSPPTRAPPLPPQQSSSSITGSSQGFQGYSLPEDDRKSIVTIRKLPSLKFQAPNESHPFAKQNKQQMVNSWIDGSEYVSSLEEFVGDHSYLGQLIN